MPVVLSSVRLHEDRHRSSHIGACVTSCAGFWKPGAHAHHCSHGPVDLPSRGAPRHKAAAPGVPLFLPLPEAQNVTENAPANGMLRPEEECLAPKTAVSRLYCYLFHAGVISESTAMHHSVICCSVPLCHDHCVIRQGCTALSEIVWDPSHAPLGCVHLTPLSSAKYLK